MQRRPGLHRRRRNRVLQWVRRQYPAIQLRRQRRALHRLPAGKAGGRLARQASSGAETGCRRRVRRVAHPRRLPARADACRRAPAGSQSRWNPARRTPPAAARWWPAARASWPLAAPCTRWRRVPLLSTAPTAVSSCREPALRLAASCSSRGAPPQPAHHTRPERFHCPAPSPPFPGRSVRDSVQESL